MAKLMDQFRNEASRHVVFRKFKLFDIPMPKVAVRGHCAHGD
jgi:hypothetical protein